MTDYWIGRKIMRTGMLFCLMVPMEQIDSETAFSPLLWTLQVMLKLYDLVNDYRINFIEFAVCVQTSNPLSNISEVCNRIIEIRGN